MHVLVHLASGIGNIVLATPLLIALNELGFTIDVLLSADYEATADLIRGWSILRHVATDGESGLLPPRAYDVVLPAIPPFYWPRFQRFYQGMPNSVTRPSDALFYENEQAYYLAFARVLGYSQDRHPEICLPVGPSAEHHAASASIILAPGSKTGEMSAKRWPWFTDLAALLPDVCVVGTADDLFSSTGAALSFPQHARNLAGKLSLRKTAELIASAGLAVANDTGLAYVAAAVGTPTIILYGPSPDRSLGPMPAHVSTLRCGLSCEPCWFAARFAQCRRQIECLRGLETERVLAVVRRITNV
jgi:ADP-heptose:LPS heptosyltransferase